MNMEQQPFRYEITARYSDSFNGRIVRAPALMAAMEEAAAEHCRAVGKDIFSLLEDGQGWILTGGGLRMWEYPSYGDVFTVDTWISEWKEFIGIREYSIRTADGRLLGEGGGRWVFWDMKSRRPKSVPKQFKERWHFRSDSPYRRMSQDPAMISFSSGKSIPQDSEKTRNSREPGDSSDIDVVERLDLEVRRGNVDLYNHLHNTTYIDWMMEAVPDGLYRDSQPMRLGIRFFGEAKLGDKVAFLSRRSGSGWHHDVVRESDEKLLVSGYSEWGERGQALSA